MTDLGSLLMQGAQELRRSECASIESAWLERLATRMEHASRLSGIALEQAVATITHALVDSGPMEESACPSFWEVAGYFQHQRRRSR